MQIECDWLCILFLYNMYIKLLEWELEQNQWVELIRRGRERILMSTQGSANKLLVNIEWLFLSAKLINVWRVCVSVGVVTKFQLCQLHLNSEDQVLFSIVQWFKLYNCVVQTCDHHCVLRPGLLLAVKVAPGWRWHRYMLIMDACNVLCKNWLDHCRLTRRADVLLVHCLRSGRSQRCEPLSTTAAKTIVRVLWVLTVIVCKSHTCAYTHEFLNSSTYWIISVLINLVKNTSTIIYVTNIPQWWRCHGGSDFYASHWIYSYYDIER